MIGFPASQSAWSVRSANRRIGKLLREPPSPAVKRVFLYGLFSGSRCRYIGQTASPQRRLIGHLHKGKIFDHGPMAMVVLRSCHESDASRLERQIVFAYRRKGQCDLNKSNHFSVAKVRKFGVKPERTEMQRVRKRVHIVLKRAMPRMPFLKRCDLAQELSEEIIRYHEDHS